jgi:archaellum component FlaC
MLFFSLQDLMSTVRSLNDEKAKRAAKSTKSVSTGTLASLARSNAGKDSQSNRNLIKRRGVDVENARPLDGVEQVGQGYGAGLLPYERKPLDNTTKTIIELENEVNSTSQKYNKMKEQTRAKSKKVEELSAQLESLRGANAKLKPEATPEMKRATELEEKITQRKQELAETEFRYSQLEHMAARLKRNHITFDGHLRMMDEAISVAEKELNDVESNLLSVSKLLYCLIDE